MPIECSDRYGVGRTACPAALSRPRPGGWSLPVRPGVGCMTHVVGRLLPPLPSGEGWGEGRCARPVQTRPHPRPLSQGERRVKARSARHGAHHAPPGVLAILVAVVLVAGGCGYSSESVYPDNVRTVSVPVFENATGESEFEFFLTEALKKEIEARTPYKVTGSAGADTIIHGRIHRVERRLLSRQVRAGLPQELEVAVTLDFEWKDQRSGEMIRQRHGFTRVGRFIAAGPVAERDASGLMQASDRIAEAIVATMSLDWRR